MKIATFNINNVNKRLGNLLDWLRTFEPDAVCLQELKAAQAPRPRLDRCRSQDPEREARSVRPAAAEEGLRACLACVTNELFWTVRLGTSPEVQRI
jgi:hypothetical protein